MSQVKSFSPSEVEVWEGGVPINVSMDPMLSNFSAASAVDREEDTYGRAPNMLKAERQCTAKASIAIEVENDASHRPV